MLLLGFMFLLIAGDAPAHADFADRSITDAPADGSWRSVAASSLLSEPILRDAMSAPLFDHD